MKSLRRTTASASPGPRPRERERGGRPTMPARGETTLNLIGGISIKYCLNLKKYIILYLTIIILICMVF